MMWRILAALLPAAIHHMGDIESYEGSRGTDGRALTRSRAMMWRILATLSSAEVARVPAGFMTAMPSSRSARNSAAMRSCSAQ